MDEYVPLLLAALILGPGAADAQDPHLETARRVLSSTPLVDGHNDLPWAIRQWEDAPRDVRAYDLRRRTPGHTDLSRLAAGMVGAQFWSVYIPCDAVAVGAARVQLEQIAIAQEIFDTYPGAFEEAYDASDVDRVFGAGRIASLMGMEGGHAIENSLGALRAFYDTGVRYMTLTHNCTNDWADAATDAARHGGLSPFGVEVVREMNRMGMMVDLSHTSPETMHDALDVAEAPVMWSHASARGVVDHPRNVPDDVLRRLPDNGGVVMVTFVPAFVGRAHSEWDRRESALREELEGRYGEDDARVERELEAWRAENPIPPATLAEVADHIEHIRDVAGVEHVGIGGDFDGISRVVVGLEDVTTYPALFAELSRRGWSEAELSGLAGENILRVMRDTERVARELQRRRAPSRMRIGG
ncbi:MAG: dipeptidase [Gemmatimonadetes bacterium]|nr:dipeptidase [Gemmatimonadota bacterium]